MYPQYLFEYPNMDTQFPFYMKKKTYTAVPPHRHGFIELSFVLEGSGSEYINAVEHNMLPGSMILLLPYQIHHYAAHPGHTLEMYICNFSMELLTESAEADWGLRDFFLADDSSRSAYVQLDGEAYREGKRIWDTLYKEYMGTFAWRPIMLKALLLEAMTWFARASGISGSDGEAKKTEAKRQRFWPIVQYVNSHYLEPLTLSLLSDRFQIHPVQISKWFAEKFGINFVDFLHELRVRHACSLLASSDMPVTEIAFESGFTSYSTFLRVFQAIKETTPKKYRDSRGALG
jgi:AraC-like DNA-binding protein